MHIAWRWREILATWSLFHIVFPCVEKIKIQLFGIIALKFHFRCDHSTSILKRTLRTRKKKSRTYSDFYIWLQEPQLNPNLNPYKKYRDNILIYISVYSDRVFNNSWKFAGPQWEGVVACHEDGTEKMTYASVSAR